MNVLVVIPLTSWDYNIQYRKEVVQAIRRNFLNFGIDIKYKIYYTASSLKNKEGVVEALNRALEHGRNCDFVWIVESDIVVPGNALKHLMFKNKDIVFGCAEASYDKNNPSQVKALSKLVMAGRFINLDQPGSQRFQTKVFTRFELEGQTAKGNVWAGLCCVLIKYNVLRTGLKFRWNDRPQSCSHDLYFYYEAQIIHKLNCVLDGNVICEHLR